MRLALLFLVSGFGLIACSTDTFVGPDGASPDGGGDDAPIGPDAPDLDAPSPEDGAAPDARPIEASTGDGGTPVLIDCDGVTCTNQICCGGGLPWGAPVCKPVANEKQLGCGNWLACDDHADCPGNQVCCATQTFNGVSQQYDLSSSYCAAGCGTAGSFQLCTGSGECGGGNCSTYKGNPSWLRTCQ